MDGILFKVKPIILRLPVEYQIFNEKMCKLIILVTIYYKIRGDFTLKIILKSSL